MQSWDDLRYFLALQRHQRLTEAGRSLNVGHTTVSRRIRELESSLNTKLFQKREAGFEMTNAGELLISYAELIEKTILNIENCVSKDDGHIKGTLRLSTPEDFGVYFLTSHLPNFLCQHEGLEIDLLYNSQESTVSRYDVDISITSERPNSGRFVVRRLAEYTLGLFASEKYFHNSKSITNAEDLSGHNFISFGNHKDLGEMITKSPLAACRNIPFRSSNLAVQYQMLQDGCGLALLPCYMKKEYENFIPVLHGEIDFKKTLWLVVDEEKRNIARVKKTADFISDAVFSNMSSLFHGF